MRSWMCRTWLVYLVTVVHGQESHIRSRERLVNEVLRIGLLRGPWLDTNRLAVADGHRTISHGCNASPGSIDVINSPLGDIWQEGYKYTLEITPADVSVGRKSNMASTKISNRIGTRNHMNLSCAASWPVLREPSLSQTDIQPCT
jgi:hypothetical protein